MRGASASKDALIALQTLGGWHYTVCIRLYALHRQPCRQNTNEDSPCMHTYPYSSSPHTLGA